MSLYHFPIQGLPDRLGPSGSVKGLKALVLFYCISYILFLCFLFSYLLFFLLIIFFFFCSVFSLFFGATETLMMAARHWPNGETCDRERALEPEW